MEEKLKIKVYRHKEEKDVYLLRNWGLCGGTVERDFYKATTDLIEAIINTYAENRMDYDFEHWMGHFNGGLYVMFKKSIAAEIDGYSGTLEKEIKLYVKDFEKVILSED